MCKLNINYSHYFIMIKTWNIMMFKMVWMASSGEFWWVRDIMISLSRGRPAHVVHHVTTVYQFFPFVYKELDVFKNRRGRLVLFRPSFLSPPPPTNLLYKCSGSIAIYSYCRVVTPHNSTQRIFPKLELVWYLLWINSL